MRQVGDAYLVASGILTPDEEGFNAVDEAHDPVRGAHRVVAYAKDMLRVARLVSGGVRLSVWVRAFVSSASHVPRSRVSRAGRGRGACVRSPALAPLVCRRWLRQWLRQQNWRPGAEALGLALVPARACMRAPLQPRPLLVPALPCLPLPPPRLPPPRCSCPTPPSP